MSARAARLTITRTLAAATHKSARSRRTETSRFQAAWPCKTAAAAALTRPVLSCRRRHRLPIDDTPNDDDPIIVASIYCTRQDQRAQPKKQTRALAISC